MCVIIAKKPGIEIPFDKIESACLVNPDGWGISVIDRGKIETFKEYHEKGNDPESVAKFLEQAKDQAAFVHLRFTTVGAKDVDNCHPFEVLDQHKNGFGIGFMHNGTVSDFKDTNSDRSDSFLINEKIIKPTVEAFYTTKGQEVLEDPTLNAIISQFCNPASCFVLYDSNGKWIVVDKKKGGVEFDGWWASNSYSFNQSHRTSKTTTSKTWDKYDDEYPFASYYGGYPRNTDTQKDSSTSANNNESKKVETPKGEIPSPKQNLDDLSDQCQMVGSAIQMAQKKWGGQKHAQVSFQYTPPSKRPTFIELADLNSLEEVTVLSEAEIDDLVVEQPGAAAILILDLLLALYNQKKEPSH